MNAETEGNYTVSSFGEFHDALEDMEQRYRERHVADNTYGMLYRGQENVEWDLKPA
jgi:hypothetical protein